MLWQLYLCILNTITIWGLEKTDNCSGYTVVLINWVQSFIEIIKNHVISNKVIEHEKKSDIFVLEENK